MIFTFSHWPIALISIFVVSCQSSIDAEVAENDFESSYELSYSKAFKVYQQDTSIYIKTHLPGQENKTIQCIHLNKMNHHQDCLFVLKKPQRVVVVSTTYLSFIELLDEVDAISEVLDKTGSPDAQHKLKSLTHRRARAV